VTLDVANRLGRVQNRTMPAYFTNMVEHWVVEVSHGRDRDAEDEWIEANVQHLWARTRYEEYVRYQFSNEMEAFYFKMRFG